MEYAVGDKIENEFNEPWISTDKYNELFNLAITGNESKLKIDYIAEVTSDNPDGETQHTHYIARIYGGLNGSGEWNDYLLDMISLVNILREHFKNVYFVDLKNDCADDVFTLRIGFSEEVNLK